MDAEQKLRDALATPWRERSEEQKSLVTAFRKAERVRAAQWYADRGLTSLRIDRRV